MYFNNDELQCVERGGLQSTQDLQNLRAPVQDINVKVVSHETHPFSSQITSESNTMIYPATPKQYCINHIET